MQAGVLHTVGRSIKQCSSHNIAACVGDWLQTMGEPQPLSSAEKRRRTALADKDYAAVVSAGGEYSGNSYEASTCCQAIARCTTAHSVIDSALQETVQPRHELHFVCPKP